MTNVLGWILALFLLCLMDLPKMWRKKDKYEIWVFGIFLLIGATYGILFELNIDLPDLNGLERMFFEPIGKKLMVPVD